MGQPQRITFVLDELFTPETRAMSDEVLGYLLTALTALDVLWLKAHPETPLLYESGIVYQEEPPGAEDWANIPMMQKLGWGDCLPTSTLVLKDDYTFAEIGSLVPGDVIMGDGVLTQVLDFAITGEKPLLAFDLNNGCVLKCSADHRLFLQDGTEVRAHDVKVGDRLKAPERFATSEQAWLPDERFSATDMAWLTGIYIADGWHAKNGTRFAISGDDETPKRGKIEQKNRVEALMLEVGVHTRRAKKYVDVHDRPLTAIMTQSGSRAPHKRVPSMRLSEPQVHAMIEGLRTDASIAKGSETVTHGTVSPTLALQLRVLYRMLGQSVHIRRWDEHGGLGENPIYRIIVREPAKEDSPKQCQTRAKNSADSSKVRGIRACEPELCCDITTDTGRFYLPESDTVVHNCEELACWRAAELQVRGIGARAGFTKQSQADGTMLYHITVILPDGRIEDPSRQLGMR